MNVHSFRRHSPDFFSQRGSALITTLLIAAVLGIGLVGYLSLSKTALKLAQRTLFVNDASNLAEAGLEEALYAFNQMNTGVATATAWSGWTLSGANATRTLPTFNRDQNGIGTVKVFVSGYDGSSSAPYVISHATITPFDRSAPIVRIVRIGMEASGVFVNGLVALSGLTFKGQPVIDSFNSNPTNSPTGPWSVYTAGLSRSNTYVIVPSGAADLGSGLIKGNLYLGAGVKAPPTSQVTGTITSDYTGKFTMPAYPTAAGVSQSYQLGSKVPSQLPAKGDKPAADGRYYYFMSDGKIEKTTIAAGTNVTIVGTKTEVSGGITVSGTATLAIYVDGTIAAGNKDALNNSNWAGALQIYTTTAEDCTISGNGELRASVFAPNADLKASGGGNKGSIVGSFVAKTATFTGGMEFHYDEALRYLNMGGGGRWAPTGWEELRYGSDLSALRTATGSFLP